MRSRTWIPMIVLLAGAGPAHAASPSAAVSLDQYEGPADQRTRSALALGDLSFARGDVLAGAMRFDDTSVGAGFGLVAGGGVPLGGPLSVRVLGSRFFGDGDYRAWRLKAGPQWGLPAGGSLGVFWVRDHNNVGSDTKSGSAECSIPLVRGWTGKLSGAYGRVGDRDGYAAAVGASWALIPRLELGGELGAARNPPATTPAPARGLLDPILGGHPNQPEPSNEVAMTTSISVRATFP